jgi:predicted phosphohydrolase
MSNSSSSMSIDFGGTFTFTMSPHYKIINLLNSKENNSNKGFNMTDLAIVGVRQTLRSMVDCKLHGHPLQITWTSIANYMDIHCQLHGHPCQLHGHP